MVETLTTRVTRILAGSAHAFFDAIEDVAPEAMMRQAIRDIDQVVSEARADLGKVEAAKHLITSQINKLNSENEQLAGQVETALESGQEGLARAGIERQTLIDDQTPVLQRALADQQDHGRELEGYVAALLAKRREMEAALQQYLAGRANGASPGAAAGKANREARIEGAQSAFDRVLARQTGVTGLTGTVGGDAQKLKELEDLARRQRIEERLAELKARLAK
jgi:phage shock protein A